MSERENKSSEHSSGMHKALRDAGFDPGIPLLLSALESVEQGIALISLEKNTGAGEALCGRVQASNPAARGNGIMAGDRLELQGLDDQQWRRIGFRLSSGIRYGDAKLFRNSESGILVIRHRWRAEQRDQGITRYTFKDIIGRSQSLANALRLAGRAARTDSSVLIVGESGTGKELVAQSIHAASSRSAGPFVAVNCGAIPRDLIESELFGHEKGAFTGALASRPGKFEQASGGTIFLDEIGEMPLAMQVRLLRVLQEREIVRIGGTKPQSVDIRVLAATNRNLDQLVLEGAFREDLLYRIKVFNVRVPSLRERADDIALLAGRFLEVFAARMELAVRGFSPELLQAMTAYSWPGNVRQLQNFVEAEANLCDTDTITHIPDYLLKGACTASSETPDYAMSPEEAASGAGSLGPGKGWGAFPDSRPGLKISSFAEQAFFRALEEHGGSVAKAGKAIGVSRATAYRMARKFGVL